MPKLLQAVRLDDSDSALFTEFGAAAAGTWLVSGGYAMCDLANGGHDRPGCRCDQAFLALASRERCTIAEVVSLPAEAFEGLIDVLAWHLLKVWGAPDFERARAAAEDEITYTAELAEPFAEGLWLTVQRRPTAGAQAIEEQYQVYDQLLIGAHRPPARPA